MKILLEIKKFLIHLSNADQIFVTMKEKREAEDKNAKAALGASRGSGQVKIKKSTTSPNLSSEEHRELWLKQNGR